MPAIPTKDKGPQSLSKRMKEVGRGVALQELQKKSPTGQPKIITTGGKSK